jgi:WD40 repeat protein
MHEEEEEDEEDSPGDSSPVSYNPVLIAVPSTLDSKSVDIFSLPSGTRLHTRITSTTETGMTMALALTRVNGILTLVAGYESGHVVVFRHNTTAGSWERRYEVKCHTQPVLSLSISPGRTWFLTTSADSLVTRHALSDGERMMKTVDSKHSGLQSVCVRSDAKVFATAGWDGRFRVFSARSLKELAVLRWHNVGCYAVEFAEILPEGEGGEEAAGEAVSAKMGVEEARVRRECGRHWVAGGAKDGKVSLWEIY